MVKVYWKCVICKNPSHCEEYSLLQEPMILYNSLKNVNTFFELSFLCTQTSAKLQQLFPVHNRQTLNWTSKKWLTKCISILKSLIADANAEYIKSQLFFTKLQWSVWVQCKLAPKQATFLFWDTKNRITISISHYYKGKDFVILEVITLPNTIR